MDRSRLLKTAGKFCIVIAIGIMVWEAFTYEYEYLPMDPSFGIPKNEITTFYEPDPERVKEINETYGEENVIYVEGRTYCLIDKDKDGYCDTISGVCDEGSEVMENTGSLRSNQFFTDFYFTIDSAVMTKDDAGNAVVEIIISNAMDEWDKVVTNVDFYDDKDVYLGRETEYTSDVMQNKKYRINVAFEPDDESWAEPAYFKLNSMSVIKSGKQQGWYINQY